MTDNESADFPWTVHVEESFPRLRLIDGVGWNRDKPVELRDVYPSDGEYCFGQRLIFKILETTIVAFSLLFNFTYLFSFKWSIHFSFFFSLFQTSFFCRGETETLLVSCVKIPRFLGGRGRSSPGRTQRAVPTCSSSEALSLIQPRR